MLNRLNRKRGQKGFTLIELLIVVAIIGIIAAILIPNLLDALQKAKQKRTVADIRNVGVAWMAWLTDQVSAASAGAGNKVDFGSFDNSPTASQLLTTLFPSDGVRYIQDVPRKDGWGFDMEYRSNDDVMQAQVMGIRSLGRSNAEDFTGDYPPGGFSQTDYDQDIVWADGFFVRYPQGLRVGN